MNIDEIQAGNIINLCVAVATFAAVVVAFFAIYENRNQAHKNWEHTQQLAKEEREHQNRPIVVPVGELFHHAADGGVDWNSQYQFTPEELQIRIDQEKQRNPNADPNSIHVAGSEQNTQKLLLHNMGDGIALNIHSFLYGPAGGGPGNQYTSWNNGPIQGKSEYIAIYTHGATNLFEQTQVDGIHLLYDSSEPSYRIARLTTTYHDIFGKRHVSIFDYIRSSLTAHRWMHVATKSGIEYDLEEIDNQKQPTQNKRKPIK